MKALVLAERIAGQRHMEAIRRGLKLNIPLFVIGAFSMVLDYFPFTWYQTTMQQLFGLGWHLFWESVTDAALNGVSLLTVLGTAYYLAKRDNRTRGRQQHPLLAAFVAFACFLAIIQPGEGGLRSFLTVAWTGRQGMFTAIAVALAAVEIFLWLSVRFTLTLRLAADIGDPVLAQGLMCIGPAMVTLCLFCGLKAGAAALNIPDLMDFFQQQLLTMLQGTGTSFVQLLQLNVFVHLLWLFGIHGNNILDPLLRQTPLTAILAPGISWEQQMEISKTFFDSFVLIGGVGTSCGLLVALRLCAKRSSMLWLVRLSIIPSLFNINELLIFGLPVVMNPVFAIPFLVVPVVSMLLTYGALVTGLVSPIIQSVYWTTPPLLSGYLATQSWSGVVLQVVIIGVSAAIYRPFVCLNEARKADEVQAAFRTAVQDAVSANPLVRNQLLVRSDAAGALARQLALDLQAALAAGQLFLEYQPQVNNARRVCGVEALLRWEHPLYGRVPPPLIVALAEESQLIDALGRWIIQTACGQARAWQAIGLTGLRMSVNVSIRQLQAADFAAFVLGVIRDNALNPAEVELELTENMAMTTDAVTSQNLATLRAHQVRLAIDDFGMGHTSLRYIKLFPVDTLKIDRMLSKDVAHDRSCQEIIASITSLCASLHIETVAEFVETPAQRDILAELGCEMYQGYLYSPALPAERVAGYIKTLEG